MRRKSHRENEGQEEEEEEEEKEEEEEEEEEKDEKRYRESHGLDMEAIQAQESEIASYLAHLSEVEFERIVGGEDDDYDGQEYTDAEARIRKGAATIEILHSALHADLPEWREAQLGLINLARRWEVAPPSLRRQEIVGVLKPGKQPLVIASYRTIALLHARVVENNRAQLTPLCCRSFLLCPM